MVPTSLEKARMGESIEVLFVLKSTVSQEDSTKKIEFGRSIMKCTKDGRTKMLYVVILDDI